MSSMIFSNWPTKNRIDPSGVYISWLTVDVKFSAIFARSSFCCKSFCFILNRIFLVMSVTKTAIAGLPTNTMRLTLILTKRF